MPNVKTTIANMSKATKKTTMDTLANALFTLGIGGLGLCVYSKDIIAGIFGIVLVLLGIWVMYLRHRWNENGKMYTVTYPSELTEQEQSEIKKSLNRIRNDMTKINNEPISTGTFTVETIGDGVDIPYGTETLVDSTGKIIETTKPDALIGVVQGQKENQEIIEVKE